MNEIRGTFNIGGTWSEIFENETEFKYCMDKIRENPCGSWEEILINGKPCVKKVYDDFGGGYDYIINHDITDIPKYIIDYFKD